MKMKGAEILIETLIDQGVTDVFGYPGGTVLDIYDAIYKRQDRIHHVLTTHEQHAAHAADGYARSTGKVGVCIATSGPGSTNLVTGIATAMLDSVPMVAITGNVGRAMIGKDGFQEVDITGITLPITKHNYFVNNVDELEEVVREAFKIAKSGRPGPVLIDIPKDVQTESTDFQPRGVVSPFGRIAPSSRRIEEAAALIDQAKKPYIYIGGGVVAAGVYDQIKELADKIDAVIGTSLMGISAIPTDHPRFLGMEGMHGHFASSVAANEADCFIAIGTRFSDRATGNVKKFAKQASIIHFDVDYAEINKNIHADVGVRGDLTLTMPELIQTVHASRHPEWIAHVGELRRKEKALEPKDISVTPHAIMEVINDIRQPASPVVTDVGQHQMWAAQYLKFSQPRTFITSGGLGTMGFGVGAAVGSAVGTGEHTILITGDGSFSMNMNEILTAVENKLPLTVVIMNNGVLGMVRQWQTLFYGKRYSNTVLTDRPVDYVKLAEAFGAKGVVTLSVDAFRDAFQAAYEGDGVTLIDCRIDKDEFVLPMLPPGGAIEDIITEKGADI
ncbi:MAG: biosynthetic-type acetolactate synthase large subunit [Oscillospiraceae bacterium]|nr:biosynthetic-type acetolactate synthase large subunit [Oscillospiraceae bacterium]